MAVAIRKENLVCDVGNLKLMLINYDIDVDIFVGGLPYNCALHYY